MADPIQVLMDEHRLIEQVLDALEAAGSKDLPGTFYAQAANFLADFADKRHHAKEEDRLFPLLEKCGVPREGGPIGVMCDEHVIGRRHVARMRELATADDRAGLRQVAADYVALLRQHIMKEDQVLFAMARSVIQGADRERLVREFEEAERVTPAWDPYEKLAGELRRQAEGA